MATRRGDRTAFGGPGTEPLWTHGNKDGVGTSYAASSRIWFSLYQGALTEIYYPTVDRPQVRDVQYLVTDGESFFHEEIRDMESTVELLSPLALGYRIRNVDPSGRYRITKEVITDPLLPVVLQRTRFDAEEPYQGKLQLYALCAPRLGGQGWGNNGYVVEVAGRELLVAEQGGNWLAMGATAPFLKLSCGYVGQSDGWLDLKQNYQMDWEFDQALDGHIALTGQIGLASPCEFTLAVALGDGLHQAVTSLLQALGLPFDVQKGKFLRRWSRVHERILPLDKCSHDGGKLYHASHSLLLSHEDKSYPGALIASLSIPWGEARGVDGSGGYHLVWTRDMVGSAMGLLAAGHRETPLRALIYLAASQQPDGGFSQNFWLDGKPHWTGVQLDEVAFPILLAWRLHKEGALEGFDPYHMVLSAAAYLIREGPATQQERWEENSGYSPSTLASNIAALICASAFARERDDLVTATFLAEYADFLAANVERWTVTTQGSLVPGIHRHYIRIHPVDIANPHASEDPNSGQIFIANRREDQQLYFPARDVVDAGFLELVRYGIRKPTDPIILDSLAVVDAVLKVETPYGPCWRRYNHDGYGQAADGGPYRGTGQGRAWPLLTGERGMHALAAGADIAPFIRAMERFATPTGMLPEQVWDEASIPELGLYVGHPTGAAMPLMWAHAEYIRLLRSAWGDQVFDLVEPVRDRYLRNQPGAAPCEVWKHNRQPRHVRAGGTCRILAAAPFKLRYSKDGWASVQESLALPTALGLFFVDLDLHPSQSAPLQFTFFWPEQDRWEGQDYMVNVRPSQALAGD